MAMLILDEEIVVLGNWDLWIREVAEHSPICFGLYVGLSYQSHFSKDK